WRRWIAGDGIGAGGDRTRGTGGLHHIGELGRDGRLPHRGLVWADGDAAGALAQFVEHPALDFKLSMQLTRTNERKGHQKWQGIWKAEIPVHDGWERGR